jgi:hypothetical protein
VVVGEDPSKVFRSSWMQLERNNSSTPPNKGTCERSRTGTNIEHEIAGRDSGLFNQAFGPLAIESMPSPSCPLHGHGTPS